MNYLHLFLNVFGYSCPAKKGFKDRQILNFLGYIPILGTLVGFIRVTRLAWPLMKVNLTKSLSYHGYGECIRGVIEITSLGAILFIPDLLATILRPICR